MLIIGLLIGLIGLAAGEAGTSQAWAAWAFLTACASCVACYWLVHNVPSTLLGRRHGGESQNRLLLVSPGVILIGVVLVSGSRRRARPVLAASWR